MVAAVVAVIVTIATAVTSATSPIDIRGKIPATFELLLKRVTSGWRVFSLYSRVLVDHQIMFHIVLVEPEIPPNTGNIARLCLAAGARLHLIEPLGFQIDDRSLRRAGMDYWHEVDVHLWPSLDALRHDAPPESRWYYFTTKSQKAYWDAEFQDGDYLVFGRETKGLPESLLAAHPEHCLTIPMQSGARSLNLATSVGIALYEAKRQLAVGIKIASNPDCARNSPHT